MRNRRAVPPRPWVALELSLQSPRRQWRASSSDRIPGRSSTGELSPTRHGYIGETEAASEKLVGLRFASATFFAEGGAGPPWLSAGGVGPVGAPLC